ncbi:hypothetical protein B7463_g5808, partial [Scytalidium lignicola]
MTKLDTVHSLTTTLVQGQPLVAVFFGGTGGIGHYTLRALATASAKNGGKGFRAYIVGRKAKAAEDIIAECHDIYPQGKYKFVKIDDLSLIKDVDRACADIVELEEKESQHPRIDYLMMCQGGSIFLPRIDTKEGLDVTMSLMYYSRMRIITKLLPLLLKSKLPPAVVSVYAAGSEAKLFPEDLSLRDLSHYSYSQARSHMAYMHTFFMENLAEQNRGKLALIHIFPGVVLGPGFQNPELPAWFRVVWNCFFVPIFGRFLTVKPDNCGNRMLSLASTCYPPRPIDESSNKEAVTKGTDGKPGSGVYSLTWNGENNFPSKLYSAINKDEMRKKVWEHTARAFEVIEAGEVFKEYFIFCADLLGLLYGSSSPFSFNPDTSRICGPDFLQTTIRDNIRLHKQILDTLDVTSVAAVIGESMESITTLEWPLCTLKDYVKTIILITTPADHSA